MADEQTFHNRPRREDVLGVARRVYPHANDQRLLETLYLHSSFPFGTPDQWEKELLAQKEAAATVFPPQ